MTIIAGPADVSRAAGPAASRPRRRRRQVIAAYLFLAPALALLGVFFLWPAYTAVQTSFYHYDAVSPAEYVGLQNFRDLFHDPRVLRATGNSLILMAVIVPAAGIFPLVMAVMVNQKLRGVSLFRLTYYLPVVTSMVAIAVMWQFLFHPQGPVNWLLLESGLSDGPIQFLLEPRWALGVIAFLEIWRSAGYFMIIYLAGLQAIPSDLNDAAAIDGAGAYRRFVSITMPLMVPYIAVCSLVAAIDAIQVFTSVFVLTQGGPQDSTLTIGYLVYDEAFSKFNLGYANSIGVTLWAVLIVLALLHYRFGRKGAVL